MNRVHESFQFLHQGKRNKIKYLKKKTKANKKEENESQRKYQFPNMQMRQPPLIIFSFVSETFIPRRIKTNLDLFSFIFFLTFHYFCFQVQHAITTSTRQRFKCN